MRDVHVALLSIAVEHGRIERERLFTLVALRLLGNRRERSTADETSAEIMRAYNELLYAGKLAEADDGWEAQVYVGGGS